MKTVPTRNTEKHGQKMISVPISLLERMRQHPEVNWSAVAVAAFAEVFKHLKG